MSACCICFVGVLNGVVDEKLATLLADIIVLGVEGVEIARLVAEGSQDEGGFGKAFGAGGSVNLAPAYACFEATFGLFSS